ncbi:hypothetical protein F01_520040 [Burkholderia cenocepacia]|nr:hypothetical protein F01_520040 [Burkholderia cenocepacia]
MPSVKTAVPRFQAMHALPASPARRRHACRPDYLSEKSCTRHPPDTYPANKTTTSPSRHSTRQATVRPAAAARTNCDGPSRNASRGGPKVSITSTRPFPT